MRKFTKNVFDTRGSNAKTSGNQYASEDNDKGVRTKDEIKPKIKSSNKKDEQDFSYSSFILPPSPFGSDVFVDDFGNRLARNRADDAFLFLSAFEDD